MKVPDINVLLYASGEASPHQTVARGWVEGALSGTERVGFAMVALLGFIRISTNPRAVATPMSPRAAFEVVEQWLGAPAAMVLDPGQEHVSVLRRLVELTGTAGNLTTDAHLAALAIENGATLATFDGDFHRFPGLQLEFLRPDG